jgi:hypothetical protein
MEMDESYLATWRWNDVLETARRGNGGKDRGRSDHFQTTSQDEKCRTISLVYLIQEDDVGPSDQWYGDDLLS